MTNHDLIKSLILTEERAKADTGFAARVIQYAKQQPTAEQDNE